MGEIQVLVDLDKENLCSFMFHKCNCCDKLINYYFIRRSAHLRNKLLEICCMKYETFV